MKNISVLYIVFLALASMSEATSESSSNSTSNSTDAHSTINPTAETPTGTPTALPTLNSITTTKIDITTANSTGNETMTTPVSSTSFTNSTSSSTTRAPPTASPYRIGTWTVTDMENNTCMVMSFNGTIALKSGGKLTTVGIPYFANANDSSCDSEDLAEFKLAFDYDSSTNFSVKLQFLLQDKYTYLYSAEISKAGKSAGSEMQVLFQTPVGMSYQCDEQTICIGEYNLTLSDMRLQPFSKKANDKQFGAAYSCNPSSGPNAALIIGLVFGAIICILLLALCYVHRKKQPRGRGYANFT